MEHFLACGGTNVHGDIDPVRSHAFHDGRGDAPHLCEQAGSSSLVHFEHVGRVRFWYDERMSEIHRTDIEEREYFVVLVYSDGRNGSYCDLAEKTV
jgi:hypothetical protein